VKHANLDDLEKDARRKRVFSVRGIIARVGESLSHVCLCQVACEKKGRSHEVALISSSDGLPDFVKDR
jgi:hypothetical protein